MKPLAMLAGCLGAVGAMGIAQAQTTAATLPPLLAAPLKVPAAPGAEIGGQTRTSFATGRDILRQDTTEVRRRSGSRSIDTFRLTYAQSALTPAGFPSPLIDAAQARDGFYELDYSRAWPQAVRANAGRYLIDLTPEARFGYSTAGTSIGGGASVKIMSPRSDARVVERLEKMGVEDGVRYGDQGRWYLFAAASGRAVGFNMSPGLANGWSTDPAALVSDAQIGVGWRKGDVQTSLGYMVRRVRVEDRYAQTFMDPPSSDQVVGLSFSYKPRP